MRVSIHALWRRRYHRDRRRRGTWAAGRGLDTRSNASLRAGIPCPTATLEPPRDRWSSVLALFTDFVTNEIVQYGYLAIFVLMLLESAAVPIPSEVTMLFLSLIHI